MVFPLLFDAMLKALLSIIFREQPSLCPYYITAQNKFQYLF